MPRVYNFSAGPAILPLDVLEIAQRELLDWHGSGVSVMEMSHRGKWFDEIAAHAEETLREVLEIPKSHKVLFLQGGATLQFAMVPMNLLRGKSQADYVCTGNWSEKAIAEAKRFCEVNIVASSKDEGYVTIPQEASWRLNSDAAYVHYTPNETIGGLEFHWIPKTGEVPLVADMSSTLLSRPLEVTHYGLIYAGAQKNIGPAGLTVVIIREDLLGFVSSTTPTLLDYKIQAKNDSRYNTPPTFAWYIAGLVFDWIKHQGGLLALAHINQKKANKLYGAIDCSGFYENPIDPACRSWMNVPFRIRDPKLDVTFLQQAEQVGLLELKGHRSVGGMRASIYNAMPEEGVDTLIAFMNDFERRYG